MNIADRTHNAPPLSERLDLDYEELKERVADILTRARDNIPSEITTDEENEALGLIVKGIREIARDVDGARTKEKQPHLDAGRTIDAFFKALETRLLKGKEVLEKRGKAFLDRKAEAERQRRIEAARIAQEEAEAKLREAQAREEAGKAVHAEMVLDEAAAAEKRATLAAQAAEESNADLARTRFGSGGGATLKTSWAYEITDFEAIPLDQLRAFIAPGDVEKAVRGFVRAGGRQLKGVRIFEDTKAAYR